MIFISRKRKWERCPKGKEFAHNLIDLDMEIVDFLEVAKDLGRPISYNLLRDAVRGRRTAERMWEEVNCVIQELWKQKGA